MTELGLPRNPRFLLNFALLTVLLFSVYYGPPLFLFNELENSYYGSFWITDPNEGGRNEYCDLKINAQIPQYLSSFVNREIVVTVENRNTTQAISVTIVIQPTIVLSELNSEQTDTVETESIFVFQPALAEIGNRYEGGNSLHFEHIPPRGIETKNLTVKVSPGLEDKTTVGFQFYLQKDGCSENVLTLNTKNIAIVDAGKTIFQSFIQILLLPPLANGFLPLVALFFTLLYEGAISGKKNILIHRIRKTAMQFESFLKGRSWLRWSHYILLPVYYMTVKFLLSSFFLFVLAVGFLYFLGWLARQALSPLELHWLIQFSSWMVAILLIFLNVVVFSMQIKEQKPGVPISHKLKWIRATAVAKSYAEKIRRYLHRLLKKRISPPAPDQMAPPPEPPGPDTPAEAPPPEPPGPDAPAEAPPPAQPSVENLPGSEPPPVAIPSPDSMENPPATIAPPAESAAPPGEPDNPVVQLQLVIELGEQTARQLGEFLDLHESDTAVKVRYYMQVDDNIEEEVAVDKAIEVATAKLTRIWETMLRSYQQEIHAALREHQLKIALDKLEQCKTMLPGLLDERVRTRFPANLARSIEELQQEVDVERSEYEKANRLLQQMRNHKDPVKQYELWQQANNSYPYHSGLDEAQRIIESHCRERIEEIIDKIEKIVEKSEIGDDKTQARNAEQICYLLTHMKRLLGLFDDLEIEYGFRYSDWHKKYCTQVT